MTVERCLACGEGAVEERVEHVTVERGGRSASYQDRRMVCGACGNVSYRGSQISEHERAQADADRAVDGLLSAGELNAIRLKYCLRQTDMEAILETGPKTWTRWERGKVPQSKAVDKFIRTIAKHPYVARQLMREAGIDNPEAEEVFALIERDERRIARSRLTAEIGKRVGLDGARIAEIAADQAFDAVLKAHGGSEAVAA